MRCKTCAHPERTEIDKAIVSNIAYRRIASQYGLGPKNIENHAKNHVKPEIDAANEAAKAEIVDQVMQYRREVHLPIMDKVKLLQDKLLKSLDGADDEALPSLSREYRGTIDLEAKLTGSYQKDRTNESDLERVARAYRQMLVDYPDMTDGYRGELLASFSKLSGVPVDAIQRQIKIQEIDGVQ